MGRRPGARAARRRVVEALALGDGYKEVDEGQSVVAAATVVAGAFGAPTQDVPLAITTLLERDATASRSQADLPAAALAALRRIADDRAELAELWAETRHADARSAQMRELSQGLELLTS